MDGAEFRQAGHYLVDFLADYFDQAGDHRVFPDVDPDLLERIFDEPLPQEGRDMAEVMRELEKKLLPYCTNVNHPGYFGLITPTPTPAGVLGDFMASALNQNPGAYSIGPSAVEMEKRTVRWLNDLVGYGEEAGGNLTSGGMMANFIGIKLGRDAISGNDIQHTGIRDRWAMYVSEERHVSVDKAVDSVGIGRQGLRKLPTDDQFRMKIDALENAIRDDRANGIKPMCVIGMGGTTNTGSVDNLRQLRRIADQEAMWLHVDAAYGGGMLISGNSPGLLDGLEFADSVTIDPHKWFYAPLDAGAILVKDGSQLTKSFGMQPAYLTDETDESDQRYQYYVHGFEQSRRFRSLKIWMSFKRYGIREIGSWIDANVGHARRLYDLCTDHPDFEPAVEPPMSAMCLRYCPAGRPLENDGELHKRVVSAIEKGGEFWISTTVLRSRTYLRVNPVNFRTTDAHIDRLFGSIVSECEKVHHTLKL
jgi:aromatic-L-amino-acid/L-tryptophan decarboxylase